MTSLDFACCVSNLRIHEEKLSLSFDTSFGFRWFYGFAYFAPRQFEETLTKLTQTRLGKSHFPLVHRQMQQVRLTSSGPLTTTDHNPSQDDTHADDQNIPSHKFSLWSQDLCHSNCSQINNLRIQFINLILEKVYPSKRNDQSEHKFTTLVASKKLKQTQVDAKETEYLKHALLDANIY